MTYGRVELPKVMASIEIKDYPFLLVVKMVKLWRVMDRDKKYLEEKEFWGEPYLLRLSLTKEYYRNLIGGILSLVKELQAPFSPSVIADLGCGPGQASLLLSEFFPEAKIYALDFSKYFIRDLETKKRDNIIPIFHDYRKRLPVNNVDFEIGLYNPIGYYSQRTDRRILHNFIKALSKNGFLFLDIINPSFVFTNFTVYSIREVENNDKTVRIINYRALKYEDGVYYEDNEISFLGLEGENKERLFQYRLWLYTPAHIDKMISPYGKIVSICGILKDGTIEAPKYDKKGLMKKFSIKEDTPRIGFIITRNRFK